MRQLVAIFLSFGAFAVFGQTPADTVESPANKRIELAQQELQKVTELVEAGALPRARLEQAQQDLADAQDDAILERTLYGELPIQDLTDKLMDEMVAAAQRRVERQQARLEEAQRLVANGIAPQSSLTPFEEDLAIRRMNLNLAHSRAHLMGELASISKFEQSIKEIQNATQIEYRDTFSPGMEHYEGSGNFDEARDLKPLASAFERKFDRPLPISAEGATSLHRAMGFDHRGRVDVALVPTDTEGTWLRRYLRSRRIPYYAFTRSVRGKATAAHIHIGPGSTRLHNAD